MLDIETLKVDLALILSAYDADHDKEKAIEKLLKIFNGNHDRSIVKNMQKIRDIGNRH